LRVRTTSGDQRWIVCKYNQHQQVRLEGMGN
jgi:hypothetical protein